MSEGLCELGDVGVRQGRLEGCLALLRLGAGREDHDVAVPGPLAAEAGGGVGPEAEGGGDDFSGAPGVADLKSGGNVCGPGGGEPGGASGLGRRNRRGQAAPGQ